MKKCLVYLDKDNVDNSLDLLEVANQIFCNEEYETYGIAINQNFNDLFNSFNYLIEVKNPNIERYDQKIVASVIEKIYFEYLFDCILIPATFFGRMLAPRLAMKLHCGLVADVTEIKKEDGILEMVRPAFSGKILAGIIKTSSGPIMMSVRQNVFKYTPVNSQSPKLITYHFEDYKSSGISQIKEVKKEKTVDIRKSEILISGGGGVMDNFSKLSVLADELNATVSASRRIVDSGIAPRSIQVGQSGKTVNPKLYIALGISGSLQHIEGIKNAEFIIAVNINKRAPICSLSNIVVEGDANEFIELLTKKIKMENSN